MSTFLSSSIKRNTLINLIGSAVPIFVSLVSVPLYLKLIGNTRYGVLAIVWILVGYFGLFDLGLGRALANKVANPNHSSRQEIETSFWTALLINTILGLVGGVILLGLGNLLFGFVFKMPSDLRPEALAALPWLAFLVLLTIASSILNNVLEGKERFFIVNVVGVLMVVLFQVVPLAIAIWYGPNLAWMISSLAFIRFAIAVLLFLACWKFVPLVGFPRFDGSLARGLLRYGGWITVTNVISPILTTLDRLIIGALIGVQSLTYYTIAQNLVTQTTILPASLSRSLFPRFSMLGVGEARDVSHKALLALAAIITPFTVCALVLLKPFLELWLGATTAGASAPIGEIILIGFWFNSLAFIPSTLLQGQGRPDLTAKFHLLELPPYLILLWTGLVIAGMEGAAWAWTLRVTADAALLFWTSHTSREQLAHLIPAAALILMAGMAALWLFDYPAWRPILGGGFVITSIVWGLQIVSQQFSLSTVVPKQWLEIFRLKYEK